MEKAREVKDKETSELSLLALPLKASPLTRTRVCHCHQSIFMIESVERRKHN